MDGRDLSAYKSHHDSIREEYKKQASGWEKMEVDPNLRWVVDLLDPSPDSEALDVAAGTGLLSRALSPRVRRVTASDITSEMLAGGRAAVEREGASNVTFEQAAAEDLPYPAASFDVVATRFSAHHFRSPGVVFEEMGRVCRPGGKILVADLVSPEDGTLAARYNELERLRDRTHTKALPPSELKKSVGDAGIKITGYHSCEIEMNLDDWMDATQTGATERRRITEAMNEEMEGSARTGLQPFRRGGKVMFLHTWGIVVGEKE